MTKVGELTRRFLARVSSGSARLALRCSIEERAAYDVAAKIEGDRDASSWARRVLSREARKALRVK